MSLRDAEIEARSGAPAGSARTALALKAALAIFLVLAGLTAARHPFNHDEFEHIHSSWMILQGQQPYTDFFEHHHPLFWYLLLPLVRLFGETTATILAARFLMLGFVLLMTVLVARLSRRIFGGPTAPLLSAGFLLSNVMFVWAGTGVRPDVPQVLLILAAVLELVRYGETSRGRHLLAAAFCASLAFLFLQKTALFLAAVPLAMVLRRRVARPARPGWGLIAAAGAVFLAPILVFLAVLAASGALPDYLACNWLFNVHRGSIVPPFYFFLATILENPLHYFLFVLLFVLSCFGRWGRRVPVLLPAAVLITVLSPFLLGSPYVQYFLLPIALMSAVAGGFLAEAIPRAANRPARAAILAALFILPPVVSFGIRDIAIGNKAQLELVDHVVRRTTPMDRVYDGRAEFNIFRPDLHYFWFMEVFLRPEAKLPTRLAARRADFDPVRLVLRYQPAFVSDVGLDPGAPPLVERYGPTKFRQPRYPANVYVRLNPAPRPARGKGGD